MEEALILLPTTGHSLSLSAVFLLPFLANLAEISEQGKNIIWGN